MNNIWNLQMGHIITTSIDAISHSVQMHPGCWHCSVAICTSTISSLAVVATVVGASTIAGAGRSLLQ
jgi:hypothetical protein